MGTVTAVGCAWTRHVSTLLSFTLQSGMPSQMMNGMPSQQMHPGLQPLMQPNGGMLQRPREGPDGEPAAKRPRVALGSNQGTSLLEAFSADEIRTHLTMLRSRPGPISPAVSFSW